MPRSTSFYLPVALLSIGEAMRANLTAQELPKLTAAAKAAGVKAD